MKTHLVRAALACFALALSTTASFAKPDSVAMGGVILSLIRMEGMTELVGDKAVTDGRGNVTFGKLRPGRYVVEIKGPSLIEAMDRFAAPARHDSGPSVSLGVGGLFGGGGSHRSNGGAGPVGGSNGGSHDHGSNGGVGLGLSVPLGSSGDHGSGDSQAPMVTFTVTIPPQPAGIVAVDPSSLSAGTYGGTVFMSQTPYCRDTAGQGMRIAFTIPAGSGAPGINVFSEDPRVVGVSVGASW